jgi:hypothetical protein
VSHRRSFVGPEFPLGVESRRLAPTMRKSQILMEVAMDVWLAVLPMMFWNFVGLVAAIVCGLWTYDRIRGR